MSNEQDAGIEALATTPVAEFEGTDIKTDPETGVDVFADRAAVKLVLDNQQQAETYMNINQWAAQWLDATTIYQSPKSSSAFDGGQTGQANVPKFMLSNHISSIVPKLMGGIFYEKPPFLLRPRPKVTQDVIDAKTALFSYQLDLMNFEEEVERAIDQMALLGTCIMKWGYTEYLKKVKGYERKGGQQAINLPTGISTSDTPESDEFEVTYKDELVSHPWIKYCDIRTVFPNPGCRVGDIRQAKWVNYRDFVDYKMLNDLREIPGYDIPEESLLKSVFMSKPSTGADNIALTMPEGMRGYIQAAMLRSFKDSANPLETPIEMIEHWTDDIVIVILICNGHNILIRNEENPYGKKPFYSANWRNIGDNFYGQGLGQLIGSEQLVEQGVTNLALDLLAYGLQPTMIRKKGFNVPTQNYPIGLGKIIDVDDDVDKSFKPLVFPPIPPDAWQAITQSQSTSASTSGANEQVVQGASSQGQRSTGMRSGTGAAAVIQANASRLDGPDGRFIRQVFEPWLYQMNELNNDLLPTSVLKQVLSDELAEKYREVDHIAFRSARIDFEVLAGSKLGAKKEMAQAIPFILQLINNPTFTENINNAGYIWDGPAVFKNFCDLAGYKFSQGFMRKMTAQEQQQHAQNSPAALQQQKLQAAQQSQLAQFQHEEQIEDQKQLGKAGNEILRQAVEQAGTSEQVEGEGGDKGFGDVTEL